MSTDISLQAREAYFSFIDEDGTDSTRILKVKKDLWYSQIILARSTEIPRIFFMASIFELDGNDAIPDSDNLKVEVWTVEVSGDEETFTPTSMLVSYSGPFKSYLSVDPSEETPYPNAKWYYLNTNLSVTEGNHYAIVFRSNLENNEVAPRIYYTQNYRQNVFPIIVGTEDEGVSWANDILSDLPDTGVVRSGCLCTGYVGKDVEEDDFDSGDVTIGGTVSSKRGYPVYLYVKNDSTQSNSASEISLSFAMLPPASSVDGYSNETDQSMMRWYYYRPATLPLSNDVFLNKTINSSATLNSTAGFVVFVQPDRLSPNPVPYFNETEIDLYATPVGIVPLYEGVQPGGTGGESNHSLDMQSILDCSNKFTGDYWAHFMEKAKKGKTDSGARIPEYSVNPKYLDFTSEKKGQEVELLAFKELSLADPNVERLRVRGFSSFVKFKGYYLGFAKYQTTSSGATANPIDGQTNKFLAISAPVDDPANWTEIKLTLTDSAANPTAAGPGGGYLDDFIGVYDAVVRNTGTSADTETLFLAFQVVPSGTNAYVNLGYSTGDPSGDFTVQLLGLENENSVDSKFDKTNQLNIDRQYSKFITPNFGNDIYLTARSTGLVDERLSKFGLWKIDLNQVFSQTVLAGQVKITDYNNGNANTSYRGFYSKVSGDIDYCETEISYVMYDGEYAYLGTDTYNGVEKNYADNYIGNVWKTKDFVRFEEVLSGSPDQLWLDELLTNSDWGYNRVAFMARVDDILHVWITPEQVDMNDFSIFQTCVHVAVDLDSNVTKLLRVFPIASGADDSDYGSGNKVSDLETFGNSKSLRKFYGGVVNGYHIYVVGAEFEGIGITGDGVYIPQIGLRWIMYDTRTINKAFYYYNDINYDADADFQFINKPGKGVYHGKSLVKYDYYESSPMFDDYPALRIVKGNPRIGAYCSVVSYAYTGVPESSIDNDMYNLEPTLVNSGGVTYLICKNYNRGMQVYKTNGVKVTPDKWGLAESKDDDNYLVDYACYERATSGFTSMIEYAAGYSVSNADGQIFIAGIKNNVEDIGQGGILNFVSSSRPKRAVMRLTNGVTKPQSLSFYYKLNLVDDYGEENTSDIARLLKDPNTSHSQLKLKAAMTWEELFTNPKVWGINLAQDINREDKNWYHLTFPNDLEDTFFRIESNNLLTKDVVIDEGQTVGSAYTPVNYYKESGNTNPATIPDPFAEILVKGLKMYDIDLDGSKETTQEKYVALSGIIHGTPIPYKSNQVIITDPKDILINSNSQGVYVSPGSEIIVDFATHMYVNQITFGVYYDGIKGQSNYSTFEFYAVPKFEKNAYGDGIISDQDWVQVGSAVYDSNQSSHEIKVDSIGMFTSTLKIKVNSGVVLRLNNLKVCSFAGDANQFDSTYVSNPELIVIDDVLGLIDGNQNNVADSYATFNREGAQLVVDVGKTYYDNSETVIANGLPVTRISMNIFGARSTTRTIAVDVWDGEGSETWVNVMTGPILDYEYSIVQWAAQQKEKSKIVDLAIYGSTENDSSLAAMQLDPYLKGNHKSNYSVVVGSNGLQGYSFRPNLFKDRTLTILSSLLESETRGEGESAYTGYKSSVTVNAQMDEDGPFAEDAGSVGLIERNLNIDFPLRQVRKVRVRILNGGSNSIRINGFKVHTPLVNGEGNAVWPHSEVNWTLRLNATVSG